MKREVNNLINILKRETNHYKKLFSLLKKEQDAIVKGEINSIVEAIKQKETITLELRIMEEARLALISKISNSLRISTDNLTIGKIIEVSETEQSENLKKIKEELCRMLDMIQKINQKNAVLLEHSIEHIKGMMNLFSKVISTNKTYQNTGQLSTGNNSCNMINNIA